MATTYFVTKAYLESQTAITKNVAASEVEPFIATAAQTWMQDILGTYFFDYLVAKFNAQTLNAAETTLVEKMKPAIAWRAAADCVVALTYQIKNKGLQKQLGDNSESVELDEMGYVKEHIEGKAEFFESFVYKYLKKNKELFAEFTADENDDGVITPQDEDNFNGDILFSE